jgi:FHA domain
MFQSSNNIKRLSLPPHTTTKRLVDGAPSCSLAVSLTSPLSDGLAENNNRYGNAGPTHLVARRTTTNGLLCLSPNKARESLSNNTITLNNIMRPTVLAERQPLAQIFEAPAWAVPAKGEARLEVSRATTTDLSGQTEKTFENGRHTFLTMVLFSLSSPQPVCETIGRQSPVDLTSTSHVLLGRSPHCNVQLMHNTSSRRHAMVFHHSNGACYIVDCGSAHGTFVNGKRIASPTTSGANCGGGVVVPHKVRRGAIIRFGGPGAPCFLLKSFSFRLNEIVPDHDSSCDDDDHLQEPDMGELVRRNTRLNALGSTAAATVRGFLRVRQQPMREDGLMTVQRKRSFDSLVSTVTLDDEDEESVQAACKRMRCSSPPFSSEALPLVRLVSPDLATITASKPRRVHFSTDGPQNFYPSLVTPEEMSAEEDN